MYSTLPSQMGISGQFYQSARADVYRHAFAAVTEETWFAKVTTQQEICNRSAGST
jgi:hypothetical protein